MMRTSHVPLYSWNSPAPLAGNTGLISVQICFRQTVRLTTEFLDWCMSVCTLYKHLSATLAAVTWSSASLIHEQAYHKTSSTKQLVNGESDYVQAWGKRTSLWTSAKLQPALSEPTHYTTGSFQSNQQYIKHVVSRHFCRSYLKADKVKKSDGMRTVEYAYHSWKYADADHRKLSKLVHACRNYSLPNLARFSETQCI